MYVSFIVYIVCSHFAGLFNFYEMPEIYDHRRQETRVKKQVGPSAAAYIGCYQDSNEKRILSGHYSYLTDNTPTKCIDVCVKKGFRFAGVQAVYQCFCGNAVPATTKTSSGNCLMRCPQDKAVWCGGSLANDVYHTNVPAQNLGCYRDSQNQRILPGHYSNLTDNRPLTCIDLCIEKGFEFAGLENTHQCFCGNDVPSTKILDTHCDMPCPLYTWLKCGGNLASDVYRTGLIMAPSAADYLGCYQDSNENRILSGHYSYLTDNTATKCIDICVKKGFRLAGVQDVHHCFCGNTVSVTTKLDISHCLMRCPQDKGLVCGGNLTNDIYRTGLIDQRLGCYRDSPQVPILPNHYSNLSDNSPSKCIDLCIEKGFQFAGVQSTQCFCGNAVPATQILDKNCDMLCPNNSKLKCGGNSANDVYHTGLTISTSTVPTTMSPEVTTCMGLMDAKYFRVVLNNETPCQYRCINRENKAIFISKLDGEVCNNGKGICIKDVCHDPSPNSGCLEGFKGVKRNCKMHCFNVLEYPGISVSLNVKDGDICITQDDHHGFCGNGKCTISLKGQKNTTREM